ncbi:MAG: hypothetical protein AB8B91_21820 [Rubripirellula sp.]
MSSNNSPLILRDDRIVKTIDQLQLRIQDRFPDGGLSQLCVQLGEVARHASQRSDWISNPIKSIRIAGYTIALILVIVFVGLVGYALLHSKSEPLSFIDLVSAVDAGLNVVILFGLAIYFLINLEKRIKRQRAIEAVHELRSIAHIIDMHQLTKDPERVLSQWSGTENSPKTNMTALQLGRYLDYCTEMLSLIGKIASLYVQHFDDPEAVAVVGEVEQLSTGLSRKIWQKIMILNQTREPMSPTPDPSPAIPPPTSQGDGA